MMNFSDIISRAVDAFGFDSEKDLAQLFKISQQNFSNRKKKGTLLAEVIEKCIDLHPEISLHWLLTGQGQRHLSEVEKSTGPIDVELLRQIIESVDEQLGIMKLKLPSMKRAELIALLYEHFSESGNEVNMGTVIKFVRLAA